MIPQPNRPKVPNPMLTPRTIAKPPRSPLLGQASSGRPAPAPTAPMMRPEPNSPESQAAKMRVAQEMGTPPQRYVPPAPQQPAPPTRYQGAATPPPPTAYPNPGWQPKPSFMSSPQLQPPPPTFKLLTPTSVAPKTPAPAAMPSMQPTPALRPEMSASLIARQNVAESMKVPFSNQSAPTPEGIVEPSYKVPETTTPLRSKPVTGPNPTDFIDWGDVDATLGEFDPETNPGPGWEWDATAPGLEGAQGRWVKTALDKIPPGVDLSDPGWTYNPEDGWQYDPDLAIKKDIVGGALAAIDKPLSEYGFNPEELKAQEDQIIRQAAEAKAKLAQQMAGRGLGGSGLEIAGLGNVDVGALSAITDLATENKALQIESRLNEIKTFLSAYGAQMDNETRNKLAEEAADLQREMFENEKSQQRESDRHTMLHNLLAQLGGEQWDPDALAWAYDQLDSGASYADVVKAMFTGADEDVTVSPSVLKAAEAADAAEASDSTGSTGGGTPSGGETAPSTGLVGVADPNPKMKTWTWQWPDLIAPNKNTSPDDPNWLASWNDYRDYAESTGQGYMSFPEFRDYWFSVIYEDQ